MRTELNNIAKRPNRKSRRKQEKLERKGQTVLLSELLDKHDRKAAVKRAEDYRKKGLDVLAAATLCLILGGLAIAAIIALA